MRGGKRKPMATSFSPILEGTPACATRQSQHIAMMQPPAIACPFTHATVGPGYWKIADINSSSRERNLWALSASSVATSRRWSPAEKEDRPPVRLPQPVEQPRHHRVPQRVLRRSFHAELEHAEERKSARRKLH